MSCSFRELKWALSITCRQDQQPQYQYKYLQFELCSIFCQFIFTAIALRDVENVECKSIVKNRYQIIWDSLTLITCLSYIVRRGIREHTNRITPLYLNQRRLLVWKAESLQYRRSKMNVMLFFVILFISLKIFIQKRMKYGYTFYITRNRVIYKLLNVGTISILNNISSYFF